MLKNTFFEIGWKFQTKTILFIYVFFSAILSCLFIYKITFSKISLFTNRTFVLIIYKNERNGPMLVADTLETFLMKNDFQCVSVIASFNSSGKIKPVYVQIKEESYRIHNCHYSHPLPNISEFQCKFIDRNCLKPLKLFYYHTECVWAVKM